MNAATNSPDVNMLESNLSEVTSALSRQNFKTEFSPVKASTVKNLLADIGLNAFLASFISHGWFSDGRRLFKLGRNVGRLAKGVAKFDVLVSNVDRAERTLDHQLATVSTREICPIPYAQSEEGNILLRRPESGEMICVDARFYADIMKHGMLANAVDARWTCDDPSSPIVVWVNGEIIALIMPIECKTKPSVDVDPIDELFLSRGRKDVKFSKTRTRKGKRVMTAAFSAGGLACRIECERRDGTWMAYVGRGANVQKILEAERLQDLRKDIETFAEYVDSVEYFDLDKAARVLPTFIKRLEG